MSKELDYNDLSDQDKEWLRARGQGNRIPGETKSDPNGSVELSSTATAEEVLAATPNTGTATRPANVVVNPANPEGYTEDDYTSWKVPDLEQEVKDRNEDREEANQINVVGTGKDDKVLKADLVAALVADDEAHASSGDSGDSGQ